MNTKSNACSCVECVGAACTCGCQSNATSACQCGCREGNACACAPRNVNIEGPSTPVNF